MRQHPVIGERIIRAIPGMGAIARAVRHEHERWDGDGYPDGISGEEIPIEARIILACDAYHAMVSDRPYRKAMSQREAMAELTDERRHAVRPAGGRSAGRATCTAAVSRAWRPSEWSRPDRDRGRCQPSSLPILKI